MHLAAQEEIWTKGMEGRKIAKRKEAMWIKPGHTYKVALCPKTPMEKTNIIKAQMRECDENNHMLALFYLFGASHTNHCSAKRQLPLGPFPC